MSIKFWQVENLELYIDYPARASAGSNLPRVGNRSYGSHVGGVSIYNPAGPTVQADIVLGDTSLIVMDQACTISISKIAVIGRQEITLLIDSATFAVTWGDTIQWLGGIAPVYTSGSLTVIKLWTIDSWVNIMGESSSSSLTYSVPVANKAGAAYQLSGSGTPRDIHQFNMSVEVLNTVVYSCYYMDALNGQLYASGATACNIVNQGYAVVMQSAGNSHIFNYSTYAIHRLMPSTYPYWIRYLVSGAVQWGDECKLALYVSETSTYAFYTGTQVILIFTKTFISTMYGSSVFSSLNYAVYSGNDAYDSANNNDTYTVAYTTAVSTAGPALSYGVGRFISYGYDKDTDVGYMIGGIDDGGLPLNSVIKYTGATSTYLGLGLILHAAIGSNRGMAQDGVHIWSLGLSPDSTKFAVATEVSIQVSTVYDDLGSASIIHGDTMIC